MNIKIVSLKKVIFLFTCSIQFTTLSMRSDVVLQQNLQQLTNALDQLQDSLKPQTSKPIQEYPFPPEIDEMIILQAIPSSLTTEEEFQKTVKNLESFSHIKRYYELFENPIFQKQAIAKIFNNISPNIINTIKFPNTISSGISLLSTINNILYNIGMLRTAKPQSPDEKIRMLIDHGISPNFFYGTQNLLHLAIKNDLPKLVQYLIEKGADINIPSNIDKKSPFIYSIEYSPRSALVLLKQEDINVTDIVNNFLSKFHDPRLWVDKNFDVLTKVFVKLLKKGTLQPPDIPKYFTNNPKTTPLGTAIIIFENSDEKNLELIKFLLEHNANPREEYYDFYIYEYTMTNPLKEAEQYPELLALFKKYI